VVQRFCRHNRFIERCPICRETVPGLAPPENPGRGAAAKSAVGAARGAKAKRAGAGGRRGPRGGPELHVRHELRAEDDGYRSPLTPGLRSSADAARLAEEIAFAEGRLVTLTTAPPDLYGEVREQEDEDQATWMSFVIAYLSPIEGPDPFVGIRAALQADWRAGELPDLRTVPLGPRTSHDPARGDATLRAYLHWAERAGSQTEAFAGEPTWTPARRFERAFERLTLPGLGRMGRFDLLVTLGRVGFYELHTDSLYLGGPRGTAPDDLTTTAAKRVFGIGDPMHLERRVQALAKAMLVPVEALDLALANWGAGERATLGVPPEAVDRHALERAHAALGLE
jgi:Alpha-glutamyl/putrescinyl thymine pyrophosphorylase clade 3